MASAEHFDMSWVSTCVVDFTHLLPKPCIYFHVRLKDGGAIIFSTSYATTGNQNHVSSAAPLWRTLDWHVVGNGAYLFGNFILGYTLLKHLSIITSLVKRLMSNWSVVYNKPFVLFAPVVIFLSWSIAHFLFHLSNLLRHPNDSKLKPLEMNSCSQSLIERPAEPNLW